LFNFSCAGSHARLTGTRPKTNPRTSSVTAKTRPIPAVRSKEATVTSISASQPSSATAASTLASVRSSVASTLRKKAGVTSTGPPQPPVRGSSTLRSAALRLGGFCPHLTFDCCSV